MTMKRELEALAGEVDLDNPRIKRRRELPAPSEATVPPVQPSMTINASNGDSIFQDTEGGVIDAGVLKDQATKLWQTVKDAVNKEYVTNHASAPLCQFSFLTVLQMADTHISEATYALQLLCDYPPNAIIQTTTTSSHNPSA